MESQRSRKMIEILIDHQSLNEMNLCVRVLFVSAVVECSRCICAGGGA